MKPLAELELQLLIVAVEIIKSGLYFDSDEVSKQEKLKLCPNHIGIVVRQLKQELNLP